MGIRMLHHRTAPPRPGVGEPACVPLPPVPALALGASTARVPATLTSAVCHVRDDLGRRLAPRSLAAPGSAEAAAPWRRWADLTRSYLALALTLLPRPRPDRRMTLFIATADPVGAHPAGSAPRRRRRRRKSRRESRRKR
ncbi:hypothetical protein AB0G32_09900 [Streptomyces sp. NPDC023723]|uniref:hypothetical protein n=1 Tax=Streptomyces sp. NPDC023723 TaxID=3154323 RepID=UPI00340BA10A